MVHIRKWRNPLKLQAELKCNGLLNRVKVLRLTQFLCFLCVLCCNDQTAFLLDLLAMQSEWVNPLTTAAEWATCYLRVSQLQFSPD